MQRAHTHDDRSLASENVRRRCPYARLVLSLSTLCSLLASRTATAGELSGYWKTSGIVFFEEATSRDPWGTGWGTLFVREDFSFGRVRMRASVRAEAISSAERGAIVYDPADREARRSPLSIRELYAVVPLIEAWDLQIGRFDLGWGRTDGYSPADAFLPRDASDPFADEKLPLWGARISGQRGNVRAEIYACFLTTPWRIPVMTGRYSPLAWAHTFLLDATTKPPRRGFETARVSMTHGDWDVGAWVRSGVRPAPLIVIGADGSELGDGESSFLPTSRRFAQENGAGFEVTRVQGPWVFRGELAYLHSRDAALGDALIWAVGAEHPAGDGTLLVTVAGNARSTPVNKAFLFDRAFLPGFIIAFDQRKTWWSWKIVWIGSMRPAGGVLKGDLTRDLNDYWKLTVGADLPHGSRKSPLGALSTARRIRATLQWSW